MLISIAVVLLLYLVCGIYTFALCVKAEKKSGPDGQGLIVLFLLFGAIWPMVLVCALFVWFVEGLTELVNKP